MSKNLIMLIYIIIILFIAWVTISWIEIVLKNIDGITINSWNFFKIFPKLF